MKNRVYIFIFLVTRIITVAQEPYTISYSKTNGLPSNAIYCVFQDSKGFMWFASNVGLTRYDGFEYKTYTSKDQTSASGSSILEDAFGRIWYENFDGYLYFVEGDSLKSLQQEKPIQYLPITLTDKHLFVFQKKGLDVFGLQNLDKLFTKQIPFTGIEFSVCSMRDFFYTEKGFLYKIDGRFQTTSTNFFKNKNVAIKQIYYHNHKIYVVGKYNSSKKMFVFDESLNHLYNLTINEPDFIQGISFTDSIVWINTPRGTHSYCEKNGKLTFKQTYFKEKNSSCIKKDRQQNHWISTTNEGVFLIPHLGTVIYPQQSVIPNKIVETKNGYIVATKKGELRLFDSLFQFKSILNQQTDNAEVYYLSYDDKNNDLFYSSKGFDYTPNINFNKNKHYEPAVKELVKINNNYYAFASSGNCGLAKFNADKNESSLWDKGFLDNQMTNAPSFSSLINGVRGKAVSYNQKNNTIYFATNIGLFKSTPTSTKEVKKDNESFYVSKLACYNNVIYALSTKGDVWRIENEKTFSLLNKRYNINEFGVKLIKQFGKTLIVVTNEFAYHLNLETEELERIELNIKAYEINDVLLSKSNLFLITNQEIIKTHIDKNNKHITSEALFEVTNFSANDKALDFRKNIKLRYNENDISIRFSILDFGNKQINKLFYSINSSSWKITPNETRLLEFAALKSGKYDIRFKLNEKLLPTKIQFTITTPFWQSVWFIFICSALVLMLSFMYYKWQVKKLKTKNKLLEEKNILLQEKIELEHNLNKSVLKSIKAQMNPHFFYNALNTIQAYIFTNDKTKANNYLAKFSKLTRVILEQSEKETITLGDEIDSLKLYLELEKMRFTEGFEYRIENKTNNNQDAIEFPPMIIQPYVENAIKHGLLHKETDKKLNIVFEEKNHLLVVTIDDNGIGRKRSGELNKIKNEKHQSFSTKANQQRLEILNAGNNHKVAVEIIDKTNDEFFPLGTTVTLKIPIQ